MPKIFLSLLLAVLLMSSHGMASTFPFLSQDRIFQVHSAVFNAFVPFHEHELNTTIKHLLEDARNTSFNGMMRDEKLRYLLFLLDNIHLLHSKLFLKFYYYLIANEKAEADAITDTSLATIREFIDALPKTPASRSVTDLSIADRHGLFTAMIRSDVNLVRQCAYYLRLLYTIAVYDGALGEKISGQENNGPKEAPIMPDLPNFATDLSYNKWKNQFDGHIDAVIVGSGPSGSVAAHEMQKHGQRVLMVESGPMLIPGAINTTADTRFMEAGGPRASEDGSIILVNGESVGGGTTVNLDMSFPPTLPMVRHRFHQWRDAGLIPGDLWTDDEISAAYAWVKNILKPRTVSFAEVNVNNAILMVGANALGIPFRRYELNQYEPNRSPFSVYKKKSSFEQLLIPAMAAKNNPLTLFHNCRVTKVLIKNNQARGVECRYEPKKTGLGIINDLYGFNIKPKTTVKILADHVIMAAGNLGTSAVLLNSNIKNKNIGRGYVAHPFIPLMGRFENVVRADIGEPSTILVDHFMPTDRYPSRPGFLIEAGLGRMSMWALLLPGMPHQVRDNFANIDHIGGFSVMITDSPNSYNRVELGTDGRPKVHYRLSDQDRQNLIEGVKTSVKILFAAGASDVSFNSYEYPLFQNGGLLSNTLTPDMDLDDVFNKFKLTRNQTSFIGAHMMGGNKIGVSPDTSVVNPNYQVWGVKGLYVIDSSIFPSSVGANPMQTIYTCAKIFVDRFLGRK
ncbi:MAG TPA: GMC family oxidoreductase [Myxococcota bacterium]|nr:GMC family oxidoreductase [Myxococcota bacterium]